MTKPKHKSPEARRKAISDKWKDPEWRANMLAKRAAFWASDKGKELHRKVVEARRIRQRQPDYRAMVSKASTGREKPTTLRATTHPTIRDLEWAAGFLEGEGCFHSARTSKRNWVPSAQVSAVQVNVEPLERLLHLFGGALKPQRRPSAEKNWQKVTAWSAAGSRARGIALTLYPLLSRRRQSQIARMFA